MRGTIKPISHNLTRLTLSLYQRVYRQPRTQPAANPLRSDDVSQRSWILPTLPS